MALNVEKGHGNISIWVEKILDWDDHPPPRKKIQGKEDIETKISKLFILL